jgi:hypothetical protein
MYTTYYVPLFHHIDQIEISVDFDSVLLSWPTTKAIKCKGIYCVSNNNKRPIVKEAFLCIYVLMLNILFTDCDK